MHNLFPSLTASCLSLSLSLCLLCATRAMLDRSTAVLCRFPCPWLGFNCLGFMLGQGVHDTHSLVGLIVTMNFKLLSLFLSLSLSLYVSISAPHHTHTHTHTLCSHFLSFFGLLIFVFPPNKILYSKALVLLHYCYQKIDKRKVNKCLC